MKTSTLETRPEEKPAPSGTLADAIREMSFRLRSGCLPDAQWDGDVFSELLAMPKPDER